MEALDGLLHDALLATALAFRGRFERYPERTRRDRAAVVRTLALRPLLAEFLERPGIRVSVYAYGELPNEVALAASEVIAEEETNALAQCT
jgi:flagellar biosynthesis component FlhA